MSRHSNDLRLVSGPAEVFAPHPTFFGLSTRTPLLLLLVCLLFGFNASFADVQTEAVLKQAQDYQQRALACGADIGCIQRLIGDMQGQFGVSSTPPFEPTTPATPAVSRKETSEDSCSECRERVALMKKHGSVASMRCEPLTIGLNWDVTRKQLRTPASRIGPSSVIKMAFSEHYPGCALLTRYQNDKDPISRMEISAAAGPGDAGALVNSVDALFGISRADLGLGPRGDKFSTAKSVDPTHFNLDFAKRQFGLDYQCDDTPGLGSSADGGSLFMPGIRVAAEKFLPPGDWSLIVGREIGHDRGIDLGSMANCKKLHAATASGKPVEHSLPFKEVSEFVVPPGRGVRSSTTDSIEGSVTLRLSFGSAPITSGKPKKAKKPGKLVVSPGDLISHRTSPKKKHQPRSKTYTLTNKGEKPLVFNASESVPWLELDSTQGTLEGGQSTTVTVSLTDAADSLKPGRYETPVKFRNITGGGGTTRKVVLTDIEKWRLTAIEKYDLLFGGGVVDGGIRVPIRTQVLIEIEAGKFKSASAEVQFAKAATFSKPPGVFQCEVDGSGSRIEKTAYSVKGWLKGRQLHLDFPKNTYELLMHCLVDKDALRDAWYHRLKKHRNKPEYKHLSDKAWEAHLKKWAADKAAPTVSAKSASTRGVLFSWSKGKGGKVSYHLSPFFTEYGTKNSVDYNSERLERLE